MKGPNDARGLVANRTRGWGRLKHAPGWLLLTGLAIFSLVLAGPVARESLAEIWTEWSTPRLTFTAEVKVSSPCAVELYYDTGHGFNGRNVIRAEVTATETWQTLEFSVPYRPTRELRLDPGAGQATVRLRRLALRAEEDDIVQWRPENVRPIAGIARFEVEGETMVVQPPVGGRDPVLYLDAPERAQAPGFVFTVEVQVSNPCVVECYYDRGQGYSERDVVRIAVPEAGKWQTLRITLPARQIRELRLDPGQGQSTVQLRRPSLHDAAGAVLADWSAARLRAGKEILAHGYENEVLTVTPTEGANDPLLFLDVPMLEITRQALPRSVPSPFTWSAYALAVGIGLFAVMIAGWRAVNVGNALTPTVRLVAAVVFLTVFGLRLYWVGKYGTWIPYFDEWDAELRTAVLPWRQGVFDWAGLWAPHNEHRVALSRLFAIATVGLNGEWETRVGMVFNAGLVGYLATIVVTAVRRPLGRGWIWSALIAAVVFGGPFDPENLVWSGQSQMYFLVVLAVLLIVLAMAAVEDPFRFGWATWLCALLSLGSIGSGLVAPGIGAAIIAARCAANRSWRWGALVIAAGLIVIAGLGLATASESQQLLAMRARNAGEFFASLRRVAPWPWPHGWLWAALLWWPAGIFAWRFPRLVRAGERWAWIVAGVLLWGATHVAALTYVRAHGALPEPRHLTLLLLAPVGAAMAALAAGPRSGAPAAIRWMLPGALALIPVAALAYAGWQGAHALPEIQQLRRHQEASVTRYLETGDADEFGRLRFPDIPYWDATPCAMLLEQSAIRDCLPSGLRQRAAERWGLTAASLRPGPLSVLARGASNVGPYFAAAGLFAMLGLALRPARLKSGARGREDL